MKASMLPLTAEINVTPFLDVLLVLIITFLAAMSARQAMEAQLSKPCDVACASNGGSIVLEVLADGSYALNAHPVSAQRLLATLHATYDARPEKVLQWPGTEMPAISRSSPRWMPRERRVSP